MHLPLQHHISHCTAILKRSIENLARTIRASSRAVKVRLSRVAIPGLVAAACAIGIVHAATTASEAKSATDDHKVRGTAHDYSSWAADPTAAGPDLPPVGRSLFDFVFTETEGNTREYQLPFPFSALIDRIRTHLDHRQIMGGTRVAIIPIGRSLQRVAAAPEFFESPRTVLAVTGEPSTDAQNAGMLLKDRLYIAYVEKTSSLEVISYNEAAGRFEFQLVKDYRAGAQPKVFYADRAICISCHQNHAPIFSRPMWRETNANGQVADMLRAAGTDMRLSTQANNGFPDEIERAAIRATDLVMLQTVWQGGCADERDPSQSRRCRAAAFAAVLQYGLSGRRGFDSDAPHYRDDFVETLSRNWSVKWPQGLRIARSSIADRNPIEAGNSEGADFDWKAAAHIPPNLDPLTPRPPQETVRVAGSKDTSRIIYGWTNSFTTGDFHTLDSLLVQRAAETGAQSTAYGAQCTARRDSSGSRLKLRCTKDPAAEHSVSLTGHVEDSGKGRLERLNFGPAGKLRSIDLNVDPVQSTNGGYVLHAVPEKAPLTTRLPDGRRLTGVKVRWSADAAQDNAAQSIDARFEAIFVDDFTLVHQAIERMLEQNPELFDGVPLMRARLMPALLRELASPEQSASEHTGHENSWCCIDDTGMPSATRDAPEIDTAAVTNEKLRPFFRYCATCHLTAEQFPPNFLSGNASQVVENLRRCAPRMLVRLSAWRTPAQQRVKSPMPPATALPALGTTAQQWASSEDFEQLRAYVEHLARETDQPSEVSTTADETYEGLPSCLLPSH